MHEILEILYENAKATPSEIAALLGKSEEEVAREIKVMENAGIIRKYITLINWEKLDQSVVFAVLELKVALQRKTGYDAVAERIARFSEVESVRLISGGHDLSVTVRGKSMKDIAMIERTSYHNVNFHLNNARKALNANTLAQATAIATRLKLI